MIGDLPDSSSIAGLATNLSGISPEVIEESVLVVYQGEFIKSPFIGASHEEEMFALKKIIAECESRLDIARFDMCRLDLPETLFGRVGAWSKSNGASGCVFLDFEKKKSHFVGGRYLVSEITAGIGLDFDRYQPIYQHRKDEIGNVIKQALTIYRHALESSDWTSKYLHCVRLFEVLADPFQLTQSNKWEKVRSRLCSHLAQDKQSYQELTDQFKLLGNIGNEGNRGLRERVIHHGELLENIYETDDQLKTLFKKIQKYVHKVIKDLMCFDGSSWQQVVVWRENRLATLGIL